MVEGEEGVGAEDRAKGRLGDDGAWERRTAGIRKGRKATRIRCQRLRIKQGNYLMEYSNFAVDCCVRVVGLIGVF